MEGHSASIDTFGVVWRLGATLFFVLLNGFFVAAEFALVKVRGARVDALVAQGRRGALTLQHIVRHLDRYLSACQLGITLASLVLGALGEPAVSVLIIAAAEKLGMSTAASSSWLPFVSIAIAFTVITSLHMTIGEQAPKMWALRRAEPTALATSPILRGFTWVFGPFISAINSVSNAMLRVAGIPTGEGHEEIHSAEEIRSILSLSARAGQISERELELTRNVFRLVHSEVRHILIPRADIEFVSKGKAETENLQLIRESKHSRLPLCEIGLDTVIGIVHVKDVLEKILEGGSVDLASIAHEVHFVPDTMAVSSFLSGLQARQGHCAAVVDEHGSVIGFAFREDALEQIVGPLGDEFDAPGQSLEEVGDGVYEAPGSISLPEIFDRLEFAIDPAETEDEETLGGHVTARLDRLPQQGDTVLVGPFLVTVLEVGNRRVERVRIETAPQEQEQE